MITYSQFENIVFNELNRDISSNKDQKKAISSNKDQSLFIVAGPGSGKTTAIVLKILKFIFVDDINPSEILATTFTRKAANELKSRILLWGDEIKENILKKIIDREITEKLNKIDFNQVIIGTVDSIAEETLRIHREPGTNLPNVIEEFIANSVMMNYGLFKNDRYLNEDLKKYLGTINNTEEIKNPSIMSDILLDIKDRLYYDQVDINEFLKSENVPGAKEALDTILDYLSELKDKNIIDFPMLEYRFLNWLNLGKLDNFLDSLKIILVDEYQDTNLLQEKIYFKLANSAINNRGSITVVGDDDQALYRFRGATVDLFTNFIERASKELNIDIKEINLSANYRSSEDIVNLCNQFVKLDDNYQAVRVKEKPKIEFSRINSDTSSETIQDSVTDFTSKHFFKENRIPILGMFRQNQEILAKDLSILIKDLLEGKTVRKKIKKILMSNETPKEKNNNYNSKKGFVELKLDEKFGSPSDIALLTYSPKELSYGNYMFPYYIKKNLLNFKRPINTFNPRGQDLQTLTPVAIFCGLLLECIDPEGKFQNSMKKIPTIAKKNMNKWRTIAKEYIDTNPEPVKPISLKTFVNYWRTRTPYGHDPNIWPETASLIELAYKIITWIDDLRDDIEGLVYLEAITQTIVQTGLFNEYSSQIYFDDKHIEEEKSVQEAIWNVFVPIATGGVSVDDNLIEILPQNKVNIMSIHQSKGLEFPLVIVDVGSRFKKNKIKTSFLRFPKEGDKSSNLEDKIRPFGPLGTGTRDPKDRAFDDLTRLYFVAFSRAQDVLLLVGLTSSIEGYIANEKQLNIPNVALGWNRNEQYIGFDEIYLI